MTAEKMIIDTFKTIKEILKSLEKRVYILEKRTTRIEDGINTEVEK